MSLHGLIAAKHSFDQSLFKICFACTRPSMPQKFRDTIIESLFPELQRFAKAFRGMQLESTLSGASSRLSKLHRGVVCGAGFGIT